MHTEKRKANLIRPGTLAEVQRLVRSEGEKLRYCLAGFLDDFYADRDPAGRRSRIAAGWVNANEIATGKDEPASDLPKGSTPTQVAAYTVVSRVLLNLDETITKE